MRPASRIGGKTQLLHIRVDHLVDILPRLSETRQPAGKRSGYCRPRPLEALLHSGKAYCTHYATRTICANCRRWSRSRKRTGRRKMQRLLRRACHATQISHLNGTSRYYSGLMALFERCYDTVLTEGFAFHEAQPALDLHRRQAWRGRAPRRVGHNLLLRLSTRKADVLRFLSDPTVPFTNNLAERDGRMMKLRQKISGGFRPGGRCGRLRRDPVADLDCQEAGVGYLTGTDQPTSPSDHGTQGSLTSLRLLSRCGSIFNTFPELTVSELGENGGKGCRIFGI